MYHHESEEIYKLLNYDAILFDVDGTLIDSAPGIINTLKEVFARMGVDTTNVNLRRYLGPPLRKSFAEHFTDPALIEKATDLYRDSYAVKGSHECAAYPGAAEMLQRLKDAGLVLCTATSKPMMQGRRVLMVGDRNDDMRGAADCGLDAAGALYGYGSREELEPFHPVLLAESCANLADQILNGQA